MKCKDFLNELTDYLDDTLSESTRAELDDHLHWCHECHVLLNTTKKTIEIYRDNQIYELPENLRSRLHQAIMNKCKGQKARKDNA